MNTDIVVVYRIRHRAVSPYSLPAVGLSAPTTPLSLLFPTSAIHICVFWLLCGAAMASDWVAWEEGFVVVYFGGPQYLVD